MSNVGEAPREVASLAKNGQKIDAAEVESHPVTMSALAQKSSAAGSSASNVSLAAHFSEVLTDCHV